MYILNKKANICKLENYLTVNKKLNKLIVKEIYKEIMTQEI